MHSGLELNQKQLFDRTCVFFIIPSISPSSFADALAVGSFLISLFTVENMRKDVISLMPRPARTAALLLFMSLVVTLLPGCSLQGEKGSEVTDSSTPHTVSAPTPDEINGDWTGTLTLTWVQRSGNKVFDDMLQQNLNEPTRMKANIICKPDGQGTITLVFVDSESENSGSGPVSYVDGNFKATVSMTTQTLSGVYLLIGTAAHSDQGIVMKGDLSGKDVFGGELTIPFKGVWTLTKPK